MKNFKNAFPLQMLFLHYSVTIKHSRVRENSKYILHSGKQTTNYKYYITNDEHIMYVINIQEFENKYIKL